MNMVWPGAMSWCVFTKPIATLDRDIGTADECTCHGLTLESSWNQTVMETSCN